MLTLATKVNTIGIKVECARTYKRKTHDYIKFIPRNLNDNGSIVRLCSYSYSKSTVKGSAYLRLFVSCYKLWWGQELGQPYFLNVILDDFLNHFCGLNCETLKLQFVWSTSQVKDLQREEKKNEGFRRCTELEHRFVWDRTEVYKRLIYWKKTWGEG